MESQSPKTSLIEAYRQIDDVIVSNMPQERSGCTAVTCYLTKDGNDRKLWCANIGDTNAILTRKDGSIKVLSVEHNASRNQDEVNRIAEIGGFITNGKVAGILSVTRAFGDNELKKYVTRKSL